MQSPDRMRHETKRNWLNGTAPDYGLTRLAKGKQGMGSRIIFRNMGVNFSRKCIVKRKTEIENYTISITDVLNIPSMISSIEC